jgi:hydroxymethylpyrimidine pyrophosphatase-like HAD family hydrolase
MKGIIALDIDGTITDQIHHLPREVKEFFENLISDGWRIIFITGRPFQWGYSALQSLQCSYYFAVQNGALILEMPQKIIKLKKYLHPNILAGMDLVCKGELSSYVVYSGYDHNDICYYRPALFDRFLLDYLLKRVNTLEERWIALESFDQLPIKEWASVKSFGHIELANRLSRRIENELHLHAPVIRDPFDPNYYVVQATHLQVDKGKTLQEFIKIVGTPPIIIAAGDDNNDASMLSVADIKIVMETAPAYLLEMADIKAPAASKQGIITGLQEALRRINGKE